MQLLLAMLEVRACVHMLHMICMYAQAECVCAYVCARVSAAAAGHAGGARVQCGVVYGRASMRTPSLCVPYFHVLDLEL